MSVTPRGEISMHPRATRVLSRFVVAMWLCSFVAPAVAAPRNNPHLTAQEQGTLELIDPFLRATERNLRTMRWWYNVSDEWQTGWLARFSSGRGTAFAHGLRDNAIVLYRTEMNYRGPGLVIPDSMNGLFRSYARLILVGKEFAELDRDADQAHWSKLFGACDDLLAAENDFYVQARDRGVQYSSVDMSYNLSLEAKPIPLKIDFIKNEIKVTRSGSIGPFSIGAAAGISGSRTGITTLVVVADGTRRIYATGGRVIEFDVPASRVRVDKEVMTIAAL